MVRTNEMVQKLIALPKPVVCAVQGSAAGAGMSLAIAADVIVAAENARFAELFGRVGLVPDCGSMFLLPRIVGLNKAKEIVFTCDWIDSQEACRLGIVNKVVPTDDLDKEARALAGKIAAGPKGAFSIAKQLLNKSMENNLHDMLDFEAYGNAICFASDEHKEGVAAFKEKRKPVFK
jgi:2-(1,2-epoxy-1,2-dihydrophenyl)acetyl-CoA isomerase